MKLALHQNKNLQKACRSMVQGEDPQKEPGFPESEPNDLNLLHLAPRWVPPAVPLPYEGGIPASS